MSVSHGPSRRTILQAAALPAAWQAGRAAPASDFQLFRDAFGERATDSVVLHVAGGRDAILECRLRKPSQRTVRRTFGELLDAGEIEFTGAVQSESMLLHRMVTPEFFGVALNKSDRGKKGTADCYYARVYQTNGQQAWSSPIWMEG